MKSRRRTPTIVAAVRLPHDLAERLRALAAFKGTTTSGLLEELVGEAVRGSVGIGRGDGPSTGQGEKLAKAARLAKEAKASR